MPLRTKFKFAFFAATTLFLALVACEIGLGVARRILPSLDYELSPPWSRNQVNDPVLGYRMSPYYTGHDANGYRNETVPEKCDLLAVGDSQTYGFAATSVESWPHQLEAATGLCVYNAGVGGYSPCEYEAVVNELLTLSPAHVLLGLYLGNDLADAYTAVYVDGRFPQLRTSTSATETAILNADNNATLRDAALALGMGEDTGPEQPGDESFARDWLHQGSSLYALARSFRYELTTSGSTPFREGLDDSFEAASARSGRVAFDESQTFRTVFRNPNLDYLAVDLNDPRIAEGLRITKLVLIRLHRQLVDRQIGFTVVLLHNKPLIYKAANQALPPEFDRLLEMEETVLREIVNYLQEQQIAYVETAFAVAQCFADQKCPFPETDDHHPNSVGYAAIAQEVAASLFPETQSRSINRGAGL